MDKQRAEPAAEAKPAIDPIAMARQAPVILEAIDLFKTFGKRPVLKGLSLKIREGEIFGLFGPDGAGKTVSFYCVLGLLKPDRGRIMLRGQDITRLPFYRRAIMGMGYLPEQPSVFRGLTVAQNIGAMVEIVEPDAVRQDARVEELMRDLDIMHLRDTAATALSGGERRRCEIARALALDPAIMLLDEPFAGIDPLTIANIKELVLDMKKRGIAVLLTDQNVDVMLELIDHACVIDEGEVIFEGTPDEMLRDPIVIEHYLGAGD